MPSPRHPRQLFFVILALPVLFLLALLFIASRSTVSDLFSTTAHPADLPSEIFGLLHFVTSPEEAHRVVTAPGDAVPPQEHDTHELDVLQLDDAAVAPDKPITLAWYALGSITKTGGRARWRAGRGSRNPAESSGWDERLRALREEYPLVVFSKVTSVRLILGDGTLADARYSFAFVFNKSYCPYSKRAKKLLATYDLTPPPKIIEVDLRADASHIKTILTRLTHHSTFPNVILNGRSLGGSDDLIRLHEGDELRHVLQESGVSVGWSGEGGEAVLA